MVAMHHDLIVPKDCTVNCGATLVVADLSSSLMEPLKLDWLLLAKKENRLRTAAVLLPHRSNHWGNFILLNQNIRYHCHIAIIHCLSMFSSSVYCLHLCQA